MNTTGSGDGQRRRHDDDEVTLHKHLGWQTFPSSQRRGTESVLSGDHSTKLAGKMRDSCFRPRSLAIKDGCSSPKLPAFSSIRCYAKNSVRLTPCSIAC